MAGEDSSISAAPNKPDKPYPKVPTLRSRFRQMGKLLRCDPEGKVNADLETVWPAGTMFAASITF